MKRVMKQAMPLVIIAAALMQGISLAVALPLHAQGVDVPEQLAGKARRPIAIVAHRGASAYAPENTMTAFRRAVELEADYIELDVQLSRDGRLVVMHDRTVDRTTDGTGHVRSLTFKELRALDAGSWFGASYRGERVPSLDEVLDAFAGKIGLIIELKHPSSSPGIERKLAYALSKRHLDWPEDPGIVVQSFDTESLKEIKTLLPHTPVAVLVSRARSLTTKDLLEYREYADAIHTKLTGLSRPLVDRIRSYGMDVMGWTVHSRWNIAALAAAGVDGFMTDDPRNVRSYMRSHGAAVLQWRSR